MKETHAMLAILTDPGLLITLIPVGVVLLGLISFEIAVGVTISTLPRSRFQQKWTPQERRRLVRMFCLVFSVWPSTAALIIAHVYLPMLYALLVDGVVLSLAGLCLYWLILGKRQRRLVMAGHCENCLYDLRASKDSEHCPECGVQLNEHPTRRKGRRRQPAQSTSPG